MSTDDNGDNSEISPRNLEHLRSDEILRQRLCEEFSPVLLNSARAKLDPRIRHLVEPEDVVQSALGTFFKHLDDGTLDVEVEQILNFLKMVVRRRCVRNVRKQLSDKRDVRRTFSPSEDEPRLDAFAASPEPAPDEIAAAKSVAERLLRELSEKEMSLFVAWCAGNSENQLAHLLNLSVRTIGRKKERLRELFKKVAMEEGLDIKEFFPFMLPDGN